jgi:membrane protein implicated in regulation of membrane protease activity
MADFDRSDGPDSAPPTNKTLIAIASVLLLIPIVALLWVGSYARETPRLAGFPFFFWYQFLWVFICAGATFAAHRLVLAARKPGPGTTGKPERMGDTGPGNDEEAGR